MQEKRIDPRLPFISPISYRKKKAFLNYKTNSLISYGSCKDISLNGARLQLVEPLEPSANIEVKLVLPVSDGVERLNLDSRVCWSRYNDRMSRFDTGISFLEAGPENRKKITDFLSLILKKKFET
jgi:hypothetical protein